MKLLKVYNIQGIGICYSKEEVDIEIGKLEDKIARRNMQIKDLKAQMKPKDYNGWTNYETWNFKLWLDNDQASYNYWRDNTRQILDTAISSEYFTARDNAIKDLAEMLQAHAEEEAPDWGASTYADLLNAAISEINFYEIAKSMINAYEE